MNVKENKVPILFLIFKRKEQTLQAFSTIKAYKPSKLYIAADGPREYVEKEDIECGETRRAVLDEIDWECEVKTLFRDKNLGCTNAVFGGISWFFEQEEYGIINEDDVVISVDFFRMCEILLPKYINENKILIISSRNHSGKYTESNEYLFSQYPNIWGWATWKRAWSLNNNTFEGWKKFPKWTLIIKFGLFQGLTMIRYFNLCADPQKRLESWDYTWCYTIIRNNGICICPNVNLSSNVGIGVGNGTNYSEGDIDPYANLAIGHINWPLNLREEILLDKEQLKADKKDFFRIRMIGLKKKINKINGRCNKK